VELHCATGFEELDGALRQDLAEELTPEQLTVLLQGTAGLYQDLRMEIKKRMKVFEEYALAEIFKVPPGLLASSAGTASEDAVQVDEEEEKRVDEELKALQVDIANDKQKSRDIRSTIAFLDALMEDVKKKMAELESVPNVVGSTTRLEEDVAYIVQKGSDVEQKLERLDSLVGVSGDDVVDSKMVDVLAQGGEAHGAYYCHCVLNLTKIIIDDDMVVCRKRCGEGSCVSLFISETGLR
jgi:archaellum component FlaC